MLHLMAAFDDLSLLVGRPGIASWHPALESLPSPGSTTCEPKHLGGAG